MNDESSKQKTSIIDEREREKPASGCLSIIMGLIGIALLLSGGLCVLYGLGVKDPSGTVLLLIGAPGLVGLIIGLWFLQIAQR